MRKPLAALLLNNAAGRSKHFREEVTGILRQKYHLEVLLATDKKKTVEKLFKLSPEILFVAGGDGTINSTIPYLLKTRAVLGILPFGSGNGLARNLRIPLNPLKAALLYLQESTKEIDIGVLNDSIYFMNVAGVGFDAFIAHEFEKSMKRGITPYVIAAIRGFFKFPEFEFETKTEKGKAFIVAFANFPQYGGEARIAPGADPSDGKLDIVFLRKPSLSYAVSRVPLLFTDMIGKLKIYKRIQASEFTLKLNPPQLSHYDGESGPSFQSIRVKVIPHAIRIFIKEKRG